MYLYRSESHSPNYHTDTALTMKERGLLCYLHSAPPATTQAASIRTLALLLVDSRESITTAIHGLEAKGYARKIKNGKNVFQDWCIVLNPKAMKRAITACAKNVDNRGGGGEKPPGKRTRGGRDSPPSRLGKATGGGGEKPPAQPSLLIKLYGHSMPTEGIFCDVYTLLKKKNLKEEIPSTFAFLWEYLLITRFPGGLPRRYSLEKWTKVFVDLQRLDHAPYSHQGIVFDWLWDWNLNSERFSWIKKATRSPLKLRRRGNGAEETYYEQIRIQVKADREPDLKQYSYKAARDLWQKQGSPGTFPNTMFTQSTEKRGTYLKKP